MTSRGRSRGGGRGGRGGVVGAASYQTSTFSIDNPGLIRGIYAPEEETDPIVARAPKFDTKEQVEVFTAKHTRCTNPQYPLCKQLYTTLVDWGQVSKYLLPKIEEYRAKYGVTPPKPISATNNYADVKPMLDSIALRLNTPLHRSVTEESSLNTLR